ncbi:MAG TPA: hypothetical protein VFG81_06725 [Anaerolineales bacterium]|jgi:hypothetical protein|nr:hypothetical protein [Anaerolineales bacterium]
MKIVKYLIFTILVGSFLSACGAASEPPTPFPESMKGYELYSWQDGDQWNFSLLVGTNREKTLEEIKAADTALRGMDALTAALEQMPAGQYITWSSRETLTFPPDDIIEQVKQISEDKGLILNLAL